MSSVLNWVKDIALIRVKDVVQTVIFALDPETIFSSFNFNPGYYGKLSNLLGRPTAYLRGTPIAYLRGTPIAYLRGTPIAYLRGTPIAYLRGTPIAYLRGTPIAYLRGTPIAPRPI